MSKFSGVWGAGTVIVEHGNILTLIMGNRPDATGTRHSETTATVTFADKGEILNATLVNDDLIQWSNNTTWKKTGDPKPLYSITTYTGHGINDGTTSPVYVTLYDSQGKEIGGEISILYGQNIPVSVPLFNRVRGAVQEEKHTPPLWGHILNDDFPLPAFIKVRIGGGDFWNCQRITVKRFNDPKGRNNLTAEFEVGLGFSTDAGEGRSHVLVKSSNFEITENILDEQDEHSSGFYIYNNTGGAVTGELFSQTVQVINAQSISTTDERGNEETNSIKVGITTGGTIVGVGAEIMTEYQQTWKKWFSKSNTRAYMGTKERSQTIKVANLPANTLRIYKLYGSYQIRTISMTNGLAEPTDFNVLLDNSLSINSSGMKIIDINIGNKKTDWNGFC